MNGAALARLPPVQLSLPALVSQCLLFNLSIYLFYYYRQILLKSQVSNIRIAFIIYLAGASPFALLSLINYPQPVLI